MRCCGTLAYLLRAAILLSLLFTVVVLGGNCKELSCQCTKFKASDVTALLAFKAQITSDPKRVLADWKSGNTCQNGWNGVCCGSDGRVQELTLESVGLHGTLSSSLGSLTELQYLYLDSNAFTGPIPASLGNLSGLGVLTLSDNQLSGPIPTSLKSLNLQLLFLDNNYLDGAVPSSIGSLCRNTVQNDVSQNCLTSTSLCSNSGQRSSKVCTSFYKSLASPPPNKKSPPPKSTKKSPPPKSTTKSPPPKSTKKSPPPKSAKKSPPPKSTKKFPPPK